jgi:hypothetical protein
LALVGPAPGGEKKKQGSKQVSIHARSVLSYKKWVLEVSQYKAKSTAKLCLSNFLFVNGG